MEVPQGQEAMKVDWISVLAAAGIVAAAASMWLAVWMQR
jgi:hypothetical protein